MDHEAVAEGDQSRRDFHARDAIAEKIDIGPHRELRIGGDDIPRQQIRLARGMDVELKQHRRLRRTFKCDVKARLDEHLQILALKSLRRFVRVQPMRLAGNAAPVAKGSHRPAPEAFFRGAVEH